MQKLAKRTLLESLDNKDFKVCYIFYGKERYDIKKTVKDILKKMLLPKDMDFNYNKISGDNFTFSKLREALQTVPFLAERRVVFLSGLEVAKLKKKDIEDFKNLIYSIPTTSVLIITIADFNLNEKNCKELKQLILVSSKNCVAVEFTHKSASELNKILCDYVKSKNCNISFQDMSFLIDRVGRDLTSLKLELDKLCAYSDKITEKEIVLLTRPVLEYSAFNITHAILEKNLGKAIEIFNDMLNSKTSLFLILGAISSCFLDIYRAKCLEINFKTRADMETLPSYGGKKIRINNAFKNCSKYSIVTLRKEIIKLSEIDFKLKTTGLDGKILMEEFMFFMVCCK